MATAYSFSAGPRAVAPRGRRYRDETPEGPSNIMHDRRVVRGNTYAAQVVPANAQAEAERLHAEQQRRMARKAGTMRRGDASAAEMFGAGMEAVPGREHKELQTDTFLEQLVDRVPESEQSTQTDPFMDRPPSPLFMPAKVGVDQATQIEHGELFDFDMEVEPILEVLVGKTLEQSMMEVLEEEELQNLKRHKEEFRQRRNAELAEVQRLEAEERRKFEEKARRLKQERERQQRETELRQKVAARSYAKAQMAVVQDRVFMRLVECGYFYDPLEREVREQFLPWVLDEAARFTDQVGLARKLADALLESALQRGQQMRQQRLEEEAARERAAQEAAAAAAQQLEEQAAQAEGADAREEGEEEEGEEAGGADDEE